MHACSRPTIFCLYINNKKEHQICLPHFHFGKSSSISQLVGCAQVGNCINKNQNFPSLLQNGHRPRRWHLRSVDQAAVLRRQSVVYRLWGWLCHMHAATVVRRTRNIHKPNDPQRMLVTWSWILVHAMLDRRWRQWRSGLRRLTDGMSKMFQHNRRRSDWWWCITEYNHRHHQRIRRNHQASMSWLPPTLAGRMESRSLCSLPRCRKKL